MLGWKCLAAVLSRTRFRRIAAAPPTSRFTLSMVDPFAFPAKKSLE
jgi:hypothetical protein